MKNFPNKQRGQAMMIATIFFLIISITIIFGLAVPVSKQKHMVANLVESRRGYFLSEAGLEDVVYRLKNGMTVDSTEILTLNNQSATITTVSDGGGRTVTSLADWNGLNRRVETKLKVGVGVAFGYGIQVGSGGFTLANNSGIVGSVSANGPIVGSNGSYITGSARATGAVSTISGVIVGTGTSGDAWAHTVNNSTVRGNLFCQTGSGNNQACNTSKADPTPDAYPVTDADVAVWKAEATAGGVFVGNKTVSGSTTSLGPIKIDGDLNIQGNATLTITGTIWVTGKIVLGNGAGAKLSPSYSSNSGVVVSDGIISLSQNAHFTGSGSASTSIMLLTTSDCPESSSCNGSPAINIENNAGAVILNAQNGTISFANGSGAKEAVGKTIALSPNAVITYDTGLMDTSFSNGPTGGWDIESWKEK
ncbi:MAG: hypothetical protein ACYC1K_03115 [Minisyncoccota bacterium]